MGDDVGAMFYEKDPADSETATDNHAHDYSADEHDAIGTNDDASDAHLHHAFEIARDLSRILHRQILLKSRTEKSACSIRLNLCLHYL